MISSILKWFLLVVSGGLLIVALSPDLQRLLNRHGLIPDQYSYGDLYNITNLRAFREDNFDVNTSLTDADKPRRHYTDVNLYTIGDSFTDIDTGYYAGGVNVHVWVGESPAVETVLDKTKKNILVLEFIERVLQERLRYTGYDNIYIKNGLVTPNHYHIPTKTEAEQNEETGWVLARFGRDINQRLEFLLFNNWPFTWFKEAKAQLLLDGFGRVPGAVISHDRQHLFYEPEIDTAYNLSAFRPITNRKLDALITNLNNIRQYYLRMGFDEVYVCLIPNKVTVLEPTYGVYNHQIEHIEANAHHHLQGPMLSMIDTLRQHPDWYHLGDGHWNKQGKRFWLRRVNQVVADWSCQR